MYKFKLNRKDYEIPNCWEELNLEQYLEVISMDFTSSDYIFNLIKIFTGLTSSDLDNLTIEVFKEIKSLFDFMTISPNFVAKKSVVIDGEEYIFKENFNKLTLGEVASISTFDSKYGAKALPYTLAILLRKSIKDEDGNVVQEDYDLDLVNRRAEMFLKQPIHLFLGSINFFLSGIEK